MKTLKIYDPAMCCSTGVCGPEVDEKLVRLAAFLKGLDKAKVEVQRYNLAQQPEAYTTNPVVANTLQEKGADALPLVFIDEELIFVGKYPDTDELADLLQIERNDRSDDSPCCSGGCCQ